MKKFRLSFIPKAALILMAALSAQAKTTVVDLAKSGIKPGMSASVTEQVNRAIAKASAKQADGDTIVVTFRKGIYHFAPHKKYQRTLFISNHDQDNPKSIGIELNGLKNVIIEGNGADLRFEGRMLPFVLCSAENCALRNLSIDFDNPQIAQITIVENDTVNHMITYRPADYVKYRITDGKFFNYGDGWELHPGSGIAFDGKTRHIVFNTSDISVGTDNVTALSDGTLRAPWNNPKLTPGTVVAMRSHARPCPAIFVDRCNDIFLEKVTVHYAEGMGLLAQNTHDITLNGFAVALRGDNDPRYFTTQADATHFSGCSGKITSVGGLYEGMMDDAINVHGTYLKVIRRIDETTFEGRYMHHQSYGFRWAEPGDTVAILSTLTMDIAHTPLTIKSVSPIDQPTEAGAKLFRIEFNEPVDASVDPESGSYGFENLTATPAVLFADNTVRNNRARGALFSTPRPVMVENNLFDHTSGSAILLCGDCNGWFETGACHDVTIRGNRFVNALTNMFQFTNAVISIYPEIPQLKKQKGYFHSNISITGNHFETFDKPLLYAKSVDGLLFEGNSVVTNSDFPAFHWNRSQILLERVNDARISE